MEKLLKLFDDYGLELEFLKCDDDIALERSAKNIQNALKRRNAFEGFLEMIKVAGQIKMTIKLKDFKKLYEKMEMPTEFKFIGPIVENYVSVEILKISDKEIYNYFLELKMEKLIRKEIERKVTENPEAYGLVPNEIKLKKMFTDQNLLTEKIDVLTETVDEFLRHDSFQEELKNFVQKIKNILEKEEDNPLWYLDYMKKNELFRQLLEKGVPKEKSE